MFRACTRHETLDTPSSGRKPSATRPAGVHAGGMKRLSALTAALALLGACSSENSASGSSTGPTAAIDTTAVATTLPATATTAATPTTQPATTTEPTTTEVCVPDGDTLAQSSDDPELMSGLVGVDIRAGAHPCYERIVIELGGTGDFPGWTVEYVDDPVRIGESDDFVEIAGAATLRITMRMWMPSMEGDGYTGSIDIFPADVAHILEMRETENNEGVSIWSIGLDAQYPFTVDVLHSPERLVIDVQAPAGS